MTTPMKPPTARAVGGPSHAGSGSGSLADLLERVLDKGVVIVGDVVVSILDIELLTLKLRLLIASVDTAQRMGIDWWQSDPFISSDAARRKELQDNGRDQGDGHDRLGEIEQENERLRKRIQELEGATGDDGR